VVKKECEGFLSYYLFLGVLSSRGIYRTSFYFLFIPRVRSLQFTRYITRYKLVYFSTPTIERFQRIHKIFNDNNINYNNKNSYSNYYPILFFFFTSTYRRMVSPSNGDYVVGAVGRGRGANNIIIIPTWPFRLRLGWRHPKELVSWLSGLSGRWVLLTLAGWWRCGIPSVRTSFWLSTARRVLVSFVK